MFDLKTIWQIPGNIWIEVLVLDVWSVGMKRWEGEGGLIVSQEYPLPALAFIA